MTQYLVYRTGSNAANQSCTFEPVPIAIVEAKSREEACRTEWLEKISVHGCPKLVGEIVADCGNLDVWSNQHLHAVPQSKARKSDWIAVLEAWDDDRPEYADEDAAYAAMFEASDDPEFGSNRPQ